MIKNLLGLVLTIIAFYFFVTDLFAFVILICAYCGIGILAFRGK